jgi:PBSX family phage terminase large subunit
VAVLNLQIYSPHKKQLQVHNDKHRFKVLNWGRRTGKSTLAVNYTFIQATQVVGRYWIVAPTYKQSKNIYWQDIIHNHIPRELIKKKNEAELTLTLINGSLIELKGADNEDSLRGAGIKGLILDEYAFMKPNVWELILRPMLADSRGWAIFISTPNGFNHFYDLSVQAQSEDRQDWWYSHATTYDNPFVAKEEIETIKQDTTEDQFAQEYLAEFRKMRGLVYKNFDRKIHVIAPSQLPDMDNFTHGLSIDFGFTNPTAVVFVGIDYDQNWYVYDEIYKAGMVTDQIYKNIQNKMGGRMFTYKVGDSAQAQEIANLAMKGLKIDPIQKTKDSITSGIRLISDMLKVQEGTGKPKLFISENCKNLIYEFETYHYPEEKAERNTPEEPVKENDHALDALRYLRLKLYYGNPNMRVYKPEKMLSRKYRK